MRSLSPTIHRALESDEKIIWSGSPALATLGMAALPALAIGLCWGLADLNALLTAGQKGDAELKAALPLFIAHMLPCWISLGYVFYLWINYRRTFYAFTSKRVLLTDGFWKSNLTSLPFSEIRDVEVSLNPIEGVLGIGTLRIARKQAPASTDSSVFKMMGISAPQAIYRQIRKASRSATSDASLSESSVSGLTG